MRVSVTGTGGGPAPPGTPGAPPPLPLPWRHAAAALADAARDDAAATHPLVVMVLGPRGSGKSTLARLVANELGSSCASASAPASARLCPSIFWVEGDAGQPEFTPPGLLSAHVLSASSGLPVLGPPHTHARPGPPAAASFLGSPNPGVDPGAYAAGVAGLGAWCRSPDAAAACAGTSDPPSQPSPSRATVINTHGWARGVGADLTGALAAALPPTHILVLASSSHPARNTPPVPWWDVAPGAPPPLVATLEAAPSEAPPGSLSATDSRAAAWLAWAVGCVGGDGSLACPAVPGAADFSAAAARLAAARPLLVRLGKGGGVGVHRPRLVWSGGGGAAPPPGHELAALNGAVVGVGVEEWEGGEDGEESSGDEEGGGEASTPSSLLGLALVRAAAADPPALYLVMPPDVAAAVRAGLKGGEEGTPTRKGRLVLQAGGSELPPALLHWSEPGGGGTAGASPYLAPWCLAGVGTGARVQASRNDLARAGQQNR